MSCWVLCKVCSLSLFGEDGSFVGFVNEHRRYVDRNGEEEDGPLRPAPAFCIDHISANQGPIESHTSVYGSFVALSTQ